MVRGRRLCETCKLGHAVLLHLLHLLGLLLLRLLQLHLLLLLGQVLGRLSVRGLVVRGPAWRQTLLPMRVPAARRKGGTVAQGSRPSIAPYVQPRGGHSDPAGTPSRRRGSGPGSICTCMSLMCSSAECIAWMVTRSAACTRWVSASCKSARLPVWCAGAAVGLAGGGPLSGTRAAHRAPAAWLPADRHLGPRPRASQPAPPLRPRSILGFPQHQRAPAAHQALVGLDHAHRAVLSASAAHDCLQSSILCLILRRLSSVG